MSYNHACNFDHSAAAVPVQVHRSTHVDEIITIFLTCIPIPDVHVDALTVVDSYGPLALNATFYVIQQTIHPICMLLAHLS